MKPTAPLTFGLRAAAITALVLALGTWFATGSHVGWTQTSIVQIQHDEITGIDYPVRQEAFIAGLEWIAAGVVTFVAFTGLSFLTQRIPVRVR